MNIKCFIAMHKPYEVPTDPLYQPLHVGAEGKEPLPGIPGDNKGQHISYKNKSHCELTGVYYGWKNMDVDALGLCHYRRYFTVHPRQANRAVKRGEDWRPYVLSKEEAEALFQEADIILPKKRRYYIETLYSHYWHTIRENHLDIARQVVAEKYPSYIPYVDKVYKQTWGYMFNMFLMTKKEYDAYCEWIFTILEECERRIDESGMTAFELRLYGRISEVLLAAWVAYEEDQGVDVKEIPVFSAEKVNWWKKGTAFLQAKFFGKKYSKSF